MKGQIGVLDEIIVDSFAGGGGASTGIELALGRPVDVAINHSESAIAMHKANHPFTEHYTESVWDVSPADICRGRKMALLWLSPDCKHFSKAKGGKPVDKNIRGLAWSALRWASLPAENKPRVIILENVEEFQTWGRLDKTTGKPDAKHKGETFKSFVNALTIHGYAVQWRELRACDYGAPTTRKRLVLIARSDGQPIVFPEPTHGKKKGLKPYHTAAECIDWSIDCPSIFERKKPLVPATMRRIARGLDKFVIKNKKPFIVPIGYGERKGQAPRVSDIDAPMSTVVSTCKQNLVMPTITKFNDKSAGQLINAPFIEQAFGGGYDGSGAGVIKPLPTVTEVDHNRLIAPTLIQYHSETNESEVRAYSPSEPINTVDGSNRYGIAAAHIQKYYGGTYEGGGSAADAPLDTVTVEERHAPTLAFMSQYYTGGGSAQAAEATQPLRTIVQNDKNTVVTVKLTAADKARNNLGYWDKVRDMLNEYAGYKLKEDEILLFKIGGAYWFIADIGMRMLTPRELYRAQGFPEDYIIEFDVNGKPYSKKEQVARCGNAVCPPLAEAVVRANLPEYAVKKPITTMKDLNKAIAA